MCAIGDASNHNSVRKLHSLSHNNPCLQCNIAITNFLVSHTFEIKFHDFIGQSTVHMYPYAKNSKTWLTYEYMAK